jgi:hypothetical protein
VKKTGRDEPIEVAIYICMETTQGISLCTYLYLKLAKMSCFSMFCFLFCKIGKQESGTGFAQGGCWGCWHQCEERGSRKRGRKVNVVQIMCTYACYLLKLFHELGRGDEREKWKR